MVYNLPPWLALKEQYVQIPLIIPGLKNPGQNIDVFLQPLVEELKHLFNHGIETYDDHQNTNFQMRAVLLWTVSDFPAYAMLSRWSTHGPRCSIGIRKRTRGQRKLRKPPGTVGKRSGRRARTSSDGTRK